jgi:DNA-binding transcriptional MerR regulator
MSAVQQRQLLAIGEVAKRTGLTVKALRHYHELGLLVPDAVDPWTGYRAYGHDGLERARAIATLRAVELPLAEMPLVLDAPQAAAARACLEAHRTRVRERQGELASLVARLDSLITGRSDMTLPSTLTTPVYRDVTARTTAAIVDTSTLEKLPRQIGETLGELFAGLGSAGVAPAGPPFTRYLEDPQTGDPFRVEVGVPVTSTEGLGGRLQASELPGGRQVVVEHHGGYDRLGESWAAFYSWIGEQELPLTGAPYEAYLTSPEEIPDPADYVTEIVFYLER